MKICVVGVGYVGLVTAACLAEAGNNVICVDNDRKRIDGLKKGVIPIYERGLGEIVRENEKLGRLEFTTDLKLGVDNCLIIFLAVGTPSNDDGSADTSAILSVASQIGQYLTEYRIIATKSTVPVGTYKKVIDVIKPQTQVPFNYASNPEFLKEGAAVEDFMHPDRIIIGTDSADVRDVMSRLYSPFMRKGNRMLFMDAASAEMTKYAANAMLAARISFMNEIAELCEQLGADVELVRQGLGSDSRIGRAFLFPGIGFGGSCLPKDVRALIATGRAKAVEMSMAEAVQQVNLKAHQRFAKRIIDYFSGRTDKTVLAVWGLAFKAKTDDVRESPAIYCIKEFLQRSIRIKAYDPEAGPAAMEALNGKIETVSNGYDALADSDALVIFTDWQEFRNPDFKVIAAKLKGRVIFDGRNLYEPGIVKQAGLEYHCIGRAAPAQNDPSG
ncbi:MAG TPA: UDP-glucose/GDP-mannose dehydrogenase family protein [Sedimentisphaerales bacterium]|nr:UDP-glucose/GDP-mannose dehydrogenase family protein [Sedimentisphaerales bacterium]